MPNFVYHSRPIQTGNVQTLVGISEVPCWQNGVRDILLAGRQQTDNGYVTTLYWLHSNQLHEFITLPSGGDNSYPGFVELSPQQAFISYYSSHEKDENGQTITAIYLAKIEIL